MVKSITTEIMMNTRNAILAAGAAVVFGVAAGECGGSMGEDGTKVPHQTFEADITPNSETVPLTADQLIASYLRDGWHATSEQRYGAAATGELVTWVDSSEGNNLGVVAGIAASCWPEREQEISVIIQGISAEAGSANSVSALVEIGRAAVQNGDVACGGFEEYLGARAKTYYPDFEPIVPGA